MLRYNARISFELIVIERECSRARSSHSPGLWTAIDSEYTYTNAERIVNEEDINDDLNAEGDTLHRENTMERKVYRNIVESFDNKSSWSKLKIVNRHFPAFLSYLWTIATTTTSDLRKKKKNSNALFTEGKNRGKRGNTIRTWILYDRGRSTGETACLLDSR